MKKCKSIPVRESWFLSPQPHHISREVGVVLLIGAAFALGSCFAAAVVRKAQAAPPNLVMAPSYAEAKGKSPESPASDDEYPKPEFKYQYEPIDDEKPVLHKKAQKGETAGGADYDEGDDLVVEPDPDDLTVSLAPIIEKDVGEEAAPSPAPTAQPTPAKERSPDIGKRTAEVR